MNSCLTASANSLILSGIESLLDKNPIRLPRTSAQTVSKPIRLAKFSKFGTTDVIGSRHSRSNLTKSSQIQFNVGKKFCKIRGEIIEDVRSVRSLCQVLPCLKLKENFFMCA